MQRKSVQISLITGLITAAVASVYSRILDVLAHTTINTTLIQMLGVLSIVFMPLAMYFGLRRLRYLRSKPLKWFESFVFGMMMVLTTALLLILIQIISTGLGASRFESIGGYFNSYAPLRTLLWFISLGIIYSFLIHFIIHFQFKRHENRT